MTKEEQKKIDFLNQAPDELDTIFHMDLTVREWRLLLEKERFKLALYLNKWGDQEKHEESKNGNNLTEWGDGYKQAIRDIYDKFKMGKILDKFYKKEVIKNE